MSVPRRDFRTRIRLTPRAILLDCCSYPEGRLPPGPNGPKPLEKPGVPPREEDSARRTLPISEGDMKTCPKHTRESLIAALQRFAEKSNKPITMAALEADQGISATT